MSRRFLLHGLDAYPGGYALNDCRADATGWRDALRPRRFDGEVIPDRESTANGILDSLRDFVRSQRRGNVATWGYSGHGSNFRDDTGTEADGRMEGLVGIDLVFVPDDAIRAVLLELPAGVALTCVFDSCFSSGVTRAFGGTAGGRARSVPASAVRAVVDADRRDRSVETADGTRWTELAACQSWEVAYEGGGNGVFTRAALQVLRTTGPQLTHAGFMRRVLAQLGEDRAQTPQLRAPAGLERRTLVTRAQT